MIEVDTPTDKNRWSKYDFLMLVIVILTGLKFTAGMEHMVDININDDVWYMFRGINMFHETPNAESSPLYSLLYYAAWLPTQNTVSTYYFVLKLLTVLPGIILFAVLRKLRIHILLSTLIAVFFLTSQMNFPVQPKPSHFALSIILVTLACISKRKNINSTMGIAAIGSLITSYVRPEFFLSFLLFTLLCIVTSFFELRKSKSYKTMLPPMLIIIVSLAMIQPLGSPAFNGGGREMFAFGQHFSLNWVRWNNSNLDPMRDWEEITSDNFGASKNIKEAAAKNPRLFFKHIAYNGARLAAKPIKLATPHPLMDPHKYSKFSGLLLFCILCLYLIRIRDKLSSRLKEACTTHKCTLLTMLLLCIPGVISCILIYPRDHYMLIPSAMTMITVAIIINHDFKFNNSATLNIFTALGVLLIVPVMSDFQKNSTDNKNTITYLSSMSIDEPVNILASEEIYAPFLGANYSNVAAHDKSSDFQTFLKEKNINIIVLSDQMKKHPKFKDDPKWKEFINNHEDYAFLVITVPNSVNRILISASIGETH